MKINTNLKKVKEDKSSFPPFANARAIKEDKSSFPPFANARAIKEFLTGRVAKIYPSKESLKKVLLSGKQLTIYIGIDPTSPNIHLGNAVPLWKLRELQDLGHKIILLIGDFTGRIGDPSDKNVTRPKLSEAEVFKNAKTYRNQAAKVLDFFSKNNPAEIKFNGEWLDKLTNKEVVELAGCFTVQQIIERDLFQRRLKEKKPIGLHEFLYPLYQGYDSVVMNVDMEIGGEDQTFNMLIGRELVKIYRHKEKFVLTTPLLKGIDGRKMSKSWGNVINITDKPNDMFGKIMSVSDDLIGDYFELCVGVPSKEIKGLPPREAKARLAREIVRMYHGEKAALRAEKEFNRIFKEKKLPTKIPAVSLKEKNLNILDLLLRTELVSSKSEAKRLIAQRGVKIDGKIESDWKKTVETKKGLVIRVGKRKFVRIA